MSDEKKKIPDLNIKAVLALNDICNLVDVDGGYEDKQSTHSAIVDLIKNYLTDLTNSITITDTSGIPFKLKNGAGTWNFELNPAGIAQFTPSGHSFRATNTNFEVFYNSGIQFKISYDLLNNFIIGVDDVGDVDMTPSGNNININGNLNLTDNLDCQEILSTLITVLGRITIDNDKLRFKYNLSTYIELYTNLNADLIIKPTGTGKIGINEINPNKTLTINGSFGFKTQTTLTTGTYNDQTTVDKKIFFADTSGGNITINGFTNGVFLQEITIYKNNIANDLIINHDNASGIQKIKTQEAVNLTFSNYGKIDLIFDGTYWIANK